MSQAPHNELSIFEELKIIDITDQQEFWGARALSKILEYREFRNFIPVIDHAKQACKKSGEPIENHFVDFHEMVPIGSGAERSMKSVKLSRYACYLIVQNASPSKTIVALGQTYFAIQTRRQELGIKSIENRLKRIEKQKDNSSK